MTVYFRFQQEGNHLLKRVDALQNFFWVQIFSDKRCEGRGSSIQPRDPWRVAWRKWILLPITLHCSQALFQSPGFVFQVFGGGEESLLPDLDVEFYSLACMLKKIWLYLSFLEDLHSTLTYSPDCKTEKHDHTARIFPLGRNNDVQRKGSICFEGNLLCSFPALCV